MRHGGRALAGLAVVVAGVLAIGVLDPAPALWLSDITYPIVAIGAGLLVAVGARYRTGRSRLSWILFGIGIGLFGVGELSWSWYELMTGDEPRLQRYRFGELG